MLSALIQNFDTVEKVIETSAKSAGSALEENETYLDSIQGKIDQFNNSVQSMWSNALNSDVVKGFVDLGTEIIKIIDKIGLLWTALLALGAFKGFGALFKSLKADGVTLKSVWQWINQLTLATRQQQIADAAAAGTTLSRTNAEKFLNLSIVKRLTTEQMDAKVKEANRAREVALTAAKEALSLAEEQYAEGLIDDIALQGAKNAVDAASVPITTVQTSMTTALGMAFKGLGASILAATKALAAFLFTNPIGWIILAVGAIAGGIAIFNHFHKSVEELTEELDGLKSELSNIQSELDSVNSELETTQDRIAELLALDKLSFVEQEELERLKKVNEELQREQDLTKLKEKQKQEETAKKFVETMDKSVNKTTYNAFGDTGFWDKLFKSDDEDPDQWTFKSSEAYINETIKKYQTFGNSTRYAAQMNDLINRWLENAEGLDYGINSETDEWLDYVYNLQDKWAIISGGENAKSNAITRIFNKEENDTVLDSINEYVEDLKSGDVNAKSSIENIIKNNKTLVEDIESSGISINDAVDYFTSLASDANYNTIEGKIAEVSKAATQFESLLKGGLFKVDDIDIGLAGLFDEEGKIIQTKLSQVFQDTSAQTREDITNLLEKSYDQIKNGTVDVEKLLSGFALKTTQQVLEMQNKILGEQNLELFPNLKDEIDGIIDKFGEFSSAVGSVVDALDTLEQARAEEAYSGSVSIETLENLMKYTDDYAKLVEIDETGAIRLSTDAEKILIEQRIQKIKTDAAAAVQTAQTNLEQAKYNAKAVNETGPVQEALTSATDGLAGAWAYLGSIIGDVTDGNFSGIFERASDAYGNVTAGREEKRTQINVSVADAEEALANALNQQNIANALTSDNVKTKYSSEEASGGNETKEEAEESLAEDGWEKLLSEYENKLALITNERDLIQAEIDRMEAQGGKASAQYYEDLIRNSEEEKALLEEKFAAQQAYLEANKGNIDENTWTEYNNAINETALAIKECEVNSIEWAEALRDIDLHYFEQITEELSLLGEELEFVNSLLEDEEVADENGNWSSAALTRMGMFTQQMELAAANAARYKEEIADVNEQYENGELSKEQYLERMSELTGAQQNAIQSYEDAKDSIVEMNEARVDAIKEGIEKEIEAFQDLTDAKKEELDAERD